MTISHDDLHTQLVTLQTRFDEYSRQSRENQKGMSEDLRLISSRLSEGSNMFTEFRTVMIEVRGTIAKMKTDHEKHGSRIDTLETAATIHRAERGVWAAMLRSPVFAWLSGIAVAAWAFLSSAGQGVTK